MQRWRWPANDASPHEDCNIKGLLYCWLIGREIGGTFATCQRRGPGNTFGNEKQCIHPDSWAGLHALPPFLSLSHPAVNHLTKLSFASVSLCTKFFWGKDNAPRRTQKKGLFILFNLPWRNFPEPATRFRFLSITYMSRSLRTGSAAPQLEGSFFSRYRSPSGGSKVVKEGLL